MMLEDWIRAYEEALKRNDEKGKTDIEKQLSRLGMDRRTLLAVIGERRRSHELRGF